MAVRDPAIMPNFQADISQVQFPDVSGAFDQFAGLTSSVTGGRVIKASTAPITPMLWQRGTLYNLGMLALNSSFPGLLPPISAFDFDTTGLGLSFYWDAPKSWGRPGQLIRRPRTLIISDLIGVGIEAWVNANFTSLFAPRNVSVASIIGNRFRSALAIGVPLNFSDLVETPLPGQFSAFNMTTSNCTTDPSTYVGGDCFVAQLWPDIFLGNLTYPFAFPYVSGGFNNQFGNPPLGPVPGYDAYNGFSPSQNDWITYYGNSIKAANDCAAVVQAATKFNTFQTVLYQYNVNLTLDGAPDRSPNPIVPDSVADQLISGGDPFISRKTFTAGDNTSILNQLMADVIAFFT